MKSTKKGSVMKDMASVHQNYIGANTSTCNSGSVYYDVDGDAAAVANNIVYFSEGWQWQDVDAAIDCFSVIFSAVGPGNSFLYSKTSFKWSQLMIQRKKPH